MADFTALKTAIQNAIKQNGNEEITGNLLQEVLLAIVTTLGDGSINELITALGTEATTRGNADTTLQQNINAEAQARGNADTALGGRIDGVVSSIEAINDAIENGYVYAGIATPSSTPASGKVFYLALTAGTYTNFGNTAVTQGINILKYNGSAWSLDAFVGIDDTPTPSSNNLVKSGGVFDEVMKNGSAFDLSAYNGGATYADLNAALTALNALPAAYKRGGMSVKFVLSSDNKYVQYRLMANAFTIDVTLWQGVDEEPIIGSKNLVESGGVAQTYLPTPFEVVNGYVSTVGIIGAGGLWDTHKYRLEQGKLLLKNNIVMSGAGLAVGFFNDYDTINQNTLIGSFNESTHEMEIPKGTKCVCISYHPINAPVEVVNFTPVNSENNSLPVESKIVAGAINQFGTIAYAGGTWITKIFRYHGGYITINGEGIGTLDADIAFYSDYNNPSQHNVISLYKRTAYTQEFLVPAGAVCFAITTKSNNDNINKVVSFSPNNEQRFIDVENFHKEYIKGNIIYKPFSFNGKTATFVGDSVTAGFTTGSTTTTENYVKLFCQKVGLTPNNRAMGGAAFTEGYNEVLTLQEQLEQSAVNSDFLFVAGGSNDWQLNVTDTDFRQAITDICDYIKDNFNGTVIFITPINCIRTNNNPLPLDYYISTLIEIVANYGYNIVCGSYFPFPSKSGVADAVFGDDIHPSELGYKIYAGSLQSVLC